MGTTLYRDVDRAWIGGVCAGLADYLDTPIEVVRIIVVFLTLVTSGAGIAVYLIAWLLIPTRSEALAGAEHGFGEGFEEEFDRAVQRTSAAVKSGIENLRADAGATDTTAAPEPGEGAATPEPVVEPAAASASSEPSAPRSETVPPSPGADASRSRRGAATRSVSWLGVALIVLGVGALIGRAVGWENVFSLWPAIIIAVGLITAVTPDGPRGWGIDRFMSGILTAVIGLVLLAIVLGYQSWGVWYDVWRLWPVFLIAAGVWVVSTALKSRWINALGTLIVIVALVFSTLWPLVLGGGADLKGPRGPRGGIPGIFLPGIVKPDEGRGPGLRLPPGIPFLTDADRGELSVRASGLTLDIGGVHGRGIADLISAETVVEEPFSLEVDERVAYATLDTSDGFLRGGSRDSAGLGLSDTIPWKARIDVGALDLTADLTAVEVDEMRINAGTADLDVTLGAPASDGSELRTACATMDLRLAVDDSIPLRIGLTPSIRDIEAPGMTTRGDGLENAAYAAAQAAGDPVWDIRIVAPIANITVESR